MASSLHVSLPDEMRAYVHNGFWHPMDTLRDKMFLEEQWETGRAKWRKW